METSVDVHPPKDWDAFLLHSPYGSVYQSTFYARYALETGAASCRYVRLYVAGEPIAQLLLMRQSPIIMQTPRVAFRASVCMGFSPMGVYRWQYGPALADPYPKGELVREIAKRIADCCRWTPVVTSPLHPLQDYRSFTEHFRQAGFGIKPTHTVIIDLKNPVPQLWASLARKSARQAVEHARKRAVSVGFSESEKDLRQFHLLQRESRAQAGLPQYAWEHTLALWKILKPPGILRLVTAKHDGKTIAGLIIACFNGMIIPLRIANSRYNIEHRLCATEMINWFVIEYGATTGQSLYDLAGVSFRTEQKAVGITRWKLKWGGRIFTFPAVRRNVAHLDALRQFWQKLRFDKTIPV